MSPLHLLLHLRLPFSLFLAPIGLLGLLAAGPLDGGRTFWIFLSLHVFLYSASNAFNSFYDKDEGPIGGLKNPPPVDKSLLHTSLVWEFLGLICAYMASPWFALLMFLYGLFSKLYSWDKTRWKAKPLAGLLCIIFGQGSLTFLAVAWTAGNGPLSSGEWAGVFQPGTWSGLPWATQLLGALVSALILWGVYPLTQVYQHKEDSRRGETSYSLWVGIKGTFVSSVLAFSLAAPVFIFFLYFLMPQELLVSLSLLGFGLVPALVYLGMWMHRVWKDENAADFKSTMTMNILASGGLNLALTALLILRG